MPPKDKLRFLLRWPLAQVVWNWICRIDPPDFDPRRPKMRPLETERLLLREFCQGDLGDVANWEEEANAKDKEAEAQRFLDFCFREYSKAGMGPWGMLLKESGRIVGNCAFPHISFRQGTAEVNYYVARQYRGENLATEALKALLAFGFGELGLTTIRGRCTPDNTSSERVMQKAGMRFEQMIGSDTASEYASRKHKLFVIMRSAYNQPSE